MAAGTHNKATVIRTIGQQVHQALQASKPRLGGILVLVRPWLVRRKICATRTSVSLCDAVWQFTYGNVKLIASNDTIKSLVLYTFSKAPTTPGSPRIAQAKSSWVTAYCRHMPFSVIKGRLSLWTVDMSLRSKPRLLSVVSNKGMPTMHESILTILLASHTSGLHIHRPSPLGQLP